MTNDIALIKRLARQWPVVIALFACLFNVKPLQAQRVTIDGQSMGIDRVDARTLIDKRPKELLPIRDQFIDIEDGKQQQLGALLQEINDIQLSNLGRNSSPSGSSRGTEVEPAGGGFQIKPRVPEIPSILTTHTIRKGEYLAALSRLYYQNDPKFWQAIYQINKGKIRNPHKVDPGQVVEIPSESYARQLMGIYQ